MNLRVEAKSTESKFKLRSRGVFETNSGLESTAETAYRMNRQSFEVSWRKQWRNPRLQICSERRGIPETEGDGGGVIWSRFRVMQRPG